MFLNVPQVSNNFFSVVDTTNLYDHFLQDAPEARGGPDLKLRGRGCTQQREKKNQGVSQRKGNK